MKLFKILANVFFSILILYGFLYLYRSHLLPFKPQPVKATSFSMQTGYYMGTGNKLEITGLGFTPDLVIIKSDTNSIPAVFKTSVMNTDNLSYFSATSDQLGGQLNFHVDGFSVGEENPFRITEVGFAVTNRANINLENIRYTWTAFTGSDCSASGNFCVGTYQGDGVNPRTISTGFQPDYVMVKRTTAVAAHFHTASQPNNETLYFSATVRDTSGNMIRSFSSSGFEVGSTDNTSGGIYYFIAFKNTAGTVKEGTYTADNIDGRSITGVGFKPDYLFVKNATNTTANNTNPVSNLNESYGDSSGFFSATANAVNNIQALESDGFQVGNDIKVNGSASDTMYYVAFAGVASHTSSGTFKMDEGVYTGNDTTQTISGLSFTPDLVIIKQTSTQYAVFRSSLMSGDTTAFLGVASANFTGGILALTSDGFVVGSSITTNNDSSVYYWQAFGNAYNPHTNSGASDFAIGATFGNAIDNRTINRLPFQPDFVSVKPATNTGGGVFRTLNHTGDLSSYYINTADAANMIQGFNSDGFELGNGTSVNTVNIINYWFAFKQGSNFTSGTYVGNATDNRDITGVGFLPDLVWIKRTTNTGGIFRSTSMVGDTTGQFRNLANVSDRIQALNSDGFQVGSGTAEANASSANYYYLAWKEPIHSTSGLPGTPGTPSFSSVTESEITVTWTAATDADEYIVERAIEANSVPFYFHIVGETDNLSFTDQALTTNSKYYYRIRAVNDVGLGPFSAYNNQTTTDAPFEIQTGYYVGNGGNLSINGLGFTPDLVILKSDTSAIATVIESSQFPDIPNSNVIFLSATANNGLANVNAENVRYTWVAFTGSDCSSSGEFCVGTYRGNGNNPRTINTGFQPNFVMLKRSTNVAGHFRTASQPTDETLYFAAAVRDISGNMIKDFTSSGFTVGSTDNTAGGLYYFIAFKNTAGKIQEGTYTANNTDNRSITGLGFKPDYVFVKNATNATAASTNPASLNNEGYGDSSSYFSATANAVNNIQALESDGFQLGNSIFVNGSATDTMYYVAFGSAEAYTASGTFEMDVGSYTGNGTLQTITGLDFTPDLVIIKGEGLLQSVFKTSLMGGDSTAYINLASANIPGAITSLNSDGFTVAGASGVSNQNGVTYHWQAFGNAFNPIDNSGADNFAIGASYGNTIDNRDIKRLPFEPELVVMKSFTSAGNAVFRTSEHTGDSTSYFSNTTDALNMIQSLNPEGFQLGTGANVNTSAVMYWWYAFKTSPNLAIGSYTGNATDDRPITGIGFQPDLVWVKRDTNTYGLFKPSSLIGDSSMYFANFNNISDRIQAFESDGFQIGGNQTETNASGGIYRYVAWKIPVVLLSVTVDDGSINYGNVTLNSSNSTLPSDINDMQTVTNDSSIDADINIRGINASGGGCVWDLDTTTALDQYIHKVCNDTDNDCTSPPANYYDLTTSYQTLKNGLATSGEIDIHLFITLPTQSTCFGAQNVDVVVQVAEP